MSRIFSLALVATSLTLGACASTGTTGGGRTSDRIARLEITTSGATTAYELISRVRPTWLRPPATGSLSGAGGDIRNQVIAVYLDGNRLGDVSSLRMISVNNIRSLQWLDAARAATVLTDVGSDPIAGAIVIRSM